MINYELAKKLKDAGFPQEIKDGEMEGRMKIPDMNVYNPTLEEILYAVRDHPMNRKDIGLHCNGDEWIAWARKTHLDEDEGGDGHRDCKGSTPSEAVFSLYLALSQKVI